MASSSARSASNADRDARTFDPTKFIHPAQAGGIELPATALTMVDNKPAVWVVDRATQQVALRPVELQRQDSSDIVVTAGLEGGEVVVTAGVHALRPGQKVRFLEGSQ